MKTRRRELLAYAASVVTIGAFQLPKSQGAREMYGLIGKMTASLDERDALIAILIEAVTDMPGCLSYIVAKDSVDENAVWITEVWDSKASHDASLSLPSVKNAIAKAKPMIAGFDKGIVTLPIGGHGLKSVEAR